MEEHKFKRLISLFIALVTVLAALLAHVQADAAHEDDRADRDSKRASTEAFGLQVRGATESNYNFYTAFEQYRELDTLREAAEKRKDKKAADRYAAMRDNLLDTSAMLSGKDPKGKPYFDAEKDDEPDFARYEAYSYLIKVQQERQEYKAASVVKDGFENKANTYIVHLTLLAVSLFLLGLAGTIATEKTRGIFTVGGVLITVITVVWAAQVYARPVEDLREHEGAIEHFAEGAGLMHMHEEKEAIAEFDQAIAKAPEYADAYLERARALMALEPADLPHALENLEKVREIEPDNDAVFTDLARCHYLQGQFEEAVTISREGLKRRPDDLQTRLQLSLSLVALGESKEARESYQASLDQAARIVAEAQKNKREAPSDIIAYLEEASTQLDELQNTLEDKKGFPPPDKVKNPEQVKKDCEDLSKQVASWELALENTGLPPSAASTAKIEEVTFSTATTTGEADERAIFKGSLAQVKLNFKYSGMKDGQTVIYRIFKDGDEIDSWRSKEAWKGGDKGEWDDEVYPGYSDSFRFEPGTYLVEIYVDYHYVADGTFTVQGAKGD